MALSLSFILVLNINIIYIKSASWLIQNRPSSAFVASSTWSTYDPDDAKWSSTAAWSPADKKEDNCWLRIDFGADHIITKVKTKGAGYGGEWTEKYRLEYKVSGGAWQNAGTFNANSDATSVVVGQTGSIIARYIRFHPTEYHSWPALRVEAYGSLLTESPTAGPTPAPTFNPTPSPTSNPTNAPTTKPTLSPSNVPSKNPTKFPTNIPTQTTLSPTKYPTKLLTLQPSNSPTSAPTFSPIKSPTSNPSKYPTKAPSKQPTYPSGQVSDNNDNGQDNDDLIKDEPATNESSDKLNSSRTIDDSMIYIVGGFACLAVCICIFMLFIIVIKKRKRKNVINDVVFGSNSNDFDKSGERVMSVSNMSMNGSDMSPKSVNTQEFNFGLAHRLQLSNLNHKREDTTDLMIGEEEIDNDDLTESEDGIIHDLNRQITPSGHQQGDDEHGMIPHIAASVEHMGDGFGIIDEDLVENDVALLGDFGNIPQPQRTMGYVEDDMDEEDEEMDIVQGATSKGGNDFALMVDDGNVQKNVLKNRKKDSLDEHGVDTMGYIDHDSDEEYDEQFVDEEHWNNSIPTKGFIKGSIGMDSYNYDAKKECNEEKDVRVEPSI